MNIVLDLVFPRKCVGCGKFGSYICKNCFQEVEFIDKPICPVCQRQAIGGKTHPGCSGKYKLDGLIVACRYKGPIRVALQKVKYRWVYDIEKILVGLVTKQLWKFDFPADTTLAPVPLHIKRKRWRGFNQSEILAATLAKNFRVKYGDFLVRKIETATQVGLTRKSRRENVKGVFALRQAQGRTIAEVEGKDIVLVDDVYTSGATMAECAKVLKKAGAKSVWGMAVTLG